jgi:3-oxoadipate enol-lactonase
MHYTTFDGLKLHFQIEGDPTGEPVLLLHGMAADRRMWQPQIKSFSTAGYMVIAPDLRGHGESERPEQFRLEDCVRDLAGLLDSLHIERCHVIGVSMGGVAAQLFALDQSNRVGKLIVVDSFSCAWRLRERINAGMAVLLLRLVPLRFQAHLVSDTYRAMDRPEVGEYLAERLLATPKKWLIETRKSLSGFSVCERLGDITAPTLVLVGDRFGSLAINMARTTAEGIPAAELAILAGGGDPSNFVAPEDFNRAALEFLTRYPRL